MEQPRKRDRCEVEVDEATEDATGLLSPQRKRLKGAIFPANVTVLAHVMKTIDMFLMSTDEAVVEAARMQDLEWLRRLVNDAGSEVVNKAFVAAAGDGFLDAVQTLELEIPTNRLEIESGKLISDAAVAAAHWGHLPVVEYILGKYQARMSTALCKVLDEAATYGHLNVVEFMAEFVGQTNNRTFEESEVLSRAISCGHIDIVKFLLEPGRYTWRYTEAFGQAIALEYHAIAELVYTRFPTDSDGDFFVHLAKEGKLEAIVYLYRNGHNSAELVANAFVEAARYGHIDIVAFFLRVGFISSEIFD